MRVTTARRRLTRSAVCATVLLVAGVPVGRAQDTASARQARVAYEELRYDVTIAAARRALGAGRMPRHEQVALYELLAYSYAALDSSARAVDAFREQLLLDPDREPDVVRVSPRITSLYASALGQVLVVRRVLVDSATFVAGDGRALLRFQVSRPAAVVTRLVGMGVDLRVDSQVLAGQGQVALSATDTAGSPIPAGRYDVIVEAIAGRERFSARGTVQVRHAPLDTLAHLRALPGYTAMTETMQPSRDWTPLGVTALFTALGGGLTLAMQHRSLGTDAPRELTIAGIASLAVGLAMSARRPSLQPVPAAIQFNRLLRDQLAQRNAEVARENQARRLRTQLTVTQVAVP